MRNFIVLLGLLCSTALFSQQGNSKNDIIVTTKGEFLQVKVTRVSENVISFNYPGETVVNEIKSGGIDKIVFASGRTQDFSGSVSATTVAPADTSQEPEVMPEPEAPSYEENLLAIVPLDFKRNGEYEKTLASTATDFVVGLVKAKAETQGITVLEMSTAIERLVEAGVSYDKLRQAGPEELREVFGAEYILFIAIDEKEKEGNSGTDATSPQESTELQRNINLKLYGADSEVEAYEVDFLENVFLNRASDSGSLVKSGKWKSSLRYLTDELFALNVFAE